MTDRAGSVTGGNGGLAGAAPNSRGVIEGAFLLLDTLREAGEAGLSQLARETGLPKASVHRLLRQLCDLGAVEQREGRYCIGPHLFWLGQSWRPDSALMAATRSPLQRLAQATGASIGLGVWAHGQATIVRGVPGEVATRVQMGPGLVWPWCTAAAKVLLAWDSPSRRGRDGGLTAQEAEEIRRNRVAFDREEVLPGVACVAVPIMHPAKDVPIAVLAALVEPAQSLSRLAELLHRTGDNVTSSLPALGKGA
ncbi:IclR family transcriptional regulator [Streptomyces sp. NPDC058457]|uniref:IclR family transcriptional regulator n=1 Tax=Streptomyces sp. NPDC058457 TaxID=3346507 RepID=UPI00364DF83C